MEPLTVLAGGALLLFLLSSKSSAKKPAAPGGGGGKTVPSGYQPGPVGPSPQQPQTSGAANYYVYGPNGFNKTLGQAKAPDMDAAMVGLAKNIANSNVLTGKGKNDGDYSLDRFWNGNAKDRTNLWGGNVTWAGLGGGQSGTLQGTVAQGLGTAHFILYGPSDWQKDLGTAETPTMDEPMKGLADVLANANVLATKEGGDYQLLKNGTLIWGKTYAF